MNTNSLKKLLLAAGLTLTLLGISPVLSQSTANAQPMAAAPSSLPTLDTGVTVSTWEDRSDELPGLIDSKKLIVGGAIAVGAIVLLATTSKKRKKRKEEEENARMRNTQRRFTVGAAQSGIDTELEKARAMLPVHLVLGYGGSMGTQSTSQALFNPAKNAVSIGINVTF